MKNKIMDWITFSWASFWIIVLLGIIGIGFVIKRACDLIEEIKNWWNSW